MRPIDWVAVKTAAGATLRAIGGDFREALRQRPAPSHAEQTRVRDLVERKVLALQTQIVDLSAATDQGGWIEGEQTEQAVVAARLLANDAQASLDFVMGHGGKAHLDALNRFVAQLAVLEGIAREMSRRQAETN